MAYDVGLLVSNNVLIKLTLSCQRHCRGTKRSITIERSNGVSLQAVDGSSASAASLQTAYGLPTLMSSHCHSPGVATITDSSIDSLRQRALQYVASLGYLQP